MKTLMYRNYHDYHCLLTILDPGVGTVEVSTTLSFQTRYYNTIHGVDQLFPTLVHTVLCKCRMWYHCCILICDRF